MYRISPKPGRTLQAGTTYRIRELGLGHFDSPYFALPNAYVEKRRRPDRRSSPRPNP